MLLKIGEERTTRGILDVFLQTYWSTSNVAVKANKSPAEIIHGRQMGTVTDFLLPIKNRYEDKNHNERMVHRLIHIMEQKKREHALRHKVYILAFLVLNKINSERQEK